MCCRSFAVAAHRRLRQRHASTAAGRRDLSRGVGDCRVGACRVGARGHARSSGDAATRRLAARRVRACRHGRGAPPPQPARAAVAPPSVKTPAPQAARQAVAPVSWRERPHRSHRRRRLHRPAAASRAITAAPTLDLDALEGAAQGDQGHRRLRQISLKNKVDDLMKQFRDHYQEQGQAHDRGAAPVLRPADDESAVAVAGRRPEDHMGRRLLARGGRGYARGRADIRRPSKLSRRLA